MFRGGGIIPLFFVLKKLLTKRVSGIDFLFSSSRIMFSTFVTNNYVIWLNYTLTRTL